MAESVNYYKTEFSTGIPSDKEKGVEICLYLLGSEAWSKTVKKFVFESVHFDTRSLEVKMMVMNNDETVDKFKYTVLELPGEIAPELCKVKDMGDGTVKVYLHKKKYFDESKGKKVYATWPDIDKGIKHC